MSVHLRLFHGRNSPDQDMEDWGFDGPTIGPLEFVHVTYLCDLKFAMPYDTAAEFFPDVAAQHAKMMHRNGVTNDAWLVDHHLSIVDDLIEHDGKFYGDFSVFVKEGT